MLGPMKKKQTPKSDATFKLTVRLPQDLARRLRLYAAEQGKTMQEITTDALGARLPRVVSVRVEYHTPKPHTATVVKEGGR